MREETVVCVEGKDVVFSYGKKKGSEEMGVGVDGEERNEREVLVLSPMVIGRGRFEVGNRRVTPAVNMEVSGVVAVEKVLPNGDLYAGGFSSNVPNGMGKYLWSDGCMYEGEWRKGKASGKGKFSWPSGATYIGEFKSGRMEGFGTFIGSVGDTYRGNWVGDRKQGYGEKWYANGDHYEGTWKKNLQDGQGRYVWSSGNEYVGEWKNGVMSGCGVLTRANGDRFEGQWENAVMKGSWVFIKADRVRGDGDLCVESGKEVPLKEVCLVGMPKENGIGLLGGKGNLRKRSSVDGPRGSLAEKPFPRICIWESDGEDGDITCDIIDNVEASMFYHDGTGLEMDGIKQFQFQSGSYRTPNEVKKPGQTVSKGHKNYELMLNLQLGIRYTVGKHALVSRKLKSSDFEPKEKFWTRFPPEGSKTTPPHQSMDFRWKDYCPVVFRHLRELFQVDPADYMLAICGNAALRELSSPGKSGSLFYLTQDDKYVIKTVTKSEVKVLIRMLSSYFEHMRKYENSLVTKFFGVHCVKPVGGQKTRFIVMGNLFCSDFPIHRRFDLKGSSHGRSTDKLEGEIDETTTLKDLDLNYVFRLQQNHFEELNKQIELDCQFLEAERIMDYSLLVGLHFRDDNTSDKIGLSPFVLCSGKSGSYQNDKFTHGYRFLEAELKNMDTVPSGRKPLFILGSNMPARAERIARSDVDHAGISRLIPHSGEVYEVVLYFGIIDILQDYDITKKLEHAYKSLQADPASISAVDPKLYSKRFQDFIKRIFIENR